MKLRYYQEICVNKIIQSFKDNNEVTLAVLPTGSGKTIIFCELVRRCLEIYGPLQAFIVVPKNILITQTVDKLSKFIDEDKIGIYNAGLKRKELDKQIIVASVQSLSVCKEIPETNLLIFDEQHRSNMDGKLESQYKIVYIKIKEKRPRAKLLGVTATPYDKNNYNYGEGKFWPKPIYERTLLELKDEGYLAPVIFKNTCKDGEMDFSQIKNVAGDYNLGQLETEILKNDKKMDLQIADALLKTANRKKVIWLTVSIKHAITIWEKLLEKNVTSSLLHSKMKWGDRNVNLEMFTYGNTKHLISVLIASEGFDYEPIDALVFMRPTRSPTLYVQATGRIMRTFPGKTDALLLDYGSIIQNLGSVYTVRVGGKKHTGNQDFKLCPECDAYVDKFQKKCECGFHFKAMCVYCHEMLLMGEKCECGGKRKIDQFRNLTKTSYDDDPDKFNIINMAISKFISKNMNRCMKVEYMGMLNTVVTEYYVDHDAYYARKKFLYFMDTHSVCMDKNISIDKFIELYKNKLIIPRSVKIRKNSSGYREIIQRNFR